MKKLLIALYVVCLVVSLATYNLKNPLYTYADELETPIEQEIDDPYIYVTDSSCYLSISNGTATISSKVYGKSGTTSTSITVYLDKLINGTWHRVTSWSHSGGQNQENTDSTTVSHGTYKVWMSITASDGNGSESFNVDGNTVGY